MGDPGVVRNGAEHDHRRVSGALRGNADAAVASAEHALRLTPRTFFSDTSQYPLLPSLTSPLAATARLWLGRGRPSRSGPISSQLCAAHGGGEAEWRPRSGSVGSRRAPSPPTTPLADLGAPKHAVAREFGERFLEGWQRADMPENDRSSGCIEVGRLIRPAPPCAASALWAHRRHRTR